MRNEIFIIINTIINTLNAKSDDYSLFAEFSKLYNDRLNDLYNELVTDDKHDLEIMFCKGILCRNCGVKSMCYSMDGVPVYIKFKDIKRLKSECPELFL